MPRLTNVAPSHVSSPRVRGFLGGSGLTDIKTSNMYFVDATGGNDANNGRAPDAAWQTIGKVNGETFQPGDRVLFKRGETWTGTGLVVPSSGEAGRPITFGAYSSGIDPIVDGNRAIANVFNTNSKSNLVIENIHIMSGTAFGLTVNASHNVTIRNIEASDCGNDNVIFTQNSHDCTLTNLNSHDNYDEGSGAALSLLEIKDGCHDISVDMATLATSVEVGLHINSHDPLQGDEFPYNLNIRNLTISDCGLKGGIRVAKEDTIANTDRNIVIDGFTITNTVGGAIGIIVVEAAGAEVINGLTMRNGAVNMLDVAAQYPFMAMGTVRFEQCTFAGTYPCRVDTKGDLTAYNCVMYRNATSTIQIRNLPVSTVFRNCIIYTTGMTIIDFQSITGTEDLDYNLYYCEGADPVTGLVYRWNGNPYNFANWKINSSQDANSTTPADPTFTSAPTDFTLQAGSPAIDAGVDVGLPYCDTAPDCGAYERCT